MTRMRDMHRLITAITISIQALGTIYWEIWKKVA